MRDKGERGGTNEEAFHKPKPFLGDTFSASKASNNTNFWGFNLNGKAKSKKKGRALNESVISNRIKSQLQRKITFDSMKVEESAAFQHKSSINPVSLRQGKEKPQILSGESFAPERNAPHKTEDVVVISSD